MDRATIAITLTLTAAIIAMAPAFAGEKNTLAQGDGDHKSKSQLVRENKRFQGQIDSLQAELTRLYSEIQYRDSLDNGFYEGSASGGSVWEFSEDATDSLVDVWYLQQSVGDRPLVEFDIDSVQWKSDLPDSVYIRRLQEMNSFISLPYNDVIKRFIILYSQKMSGRIEKILGLCAYYMPMFDEIFNEYGLPEELKALAVIESALNPLAISRAGARGMWQFMYRTAKLYGLNINSFVDERLDPIMSARAAARYLKESYDIFGDWSLAIASYNCGTGNVNRAIRRSGGKHTFWDVYPYLPRETRGYVPAFVGSLYTMRYYREHGITPEVPPLPSPVDTFKITKRLHFKQVSEVVGIPLQDLRILHPQYSHDIVPGNDREYILRIPYKYVNAFVDAEDSLYSYKESEYFSAANLKKIQDGGDGERIVYTVRSGDVLGKIAGRYRVSVNQIKRWNNLRSDNIRIGQKLVIYRGGVGAPATTASSSSSTSSSSASSSGSSSSSGTTAKTSSSGSTSSATTSSSDSSDGYTTYKVKRGDTLYDIAKLYPGISAQNIMDFNGMTSSKIREGLILKIPNR